MSIERYKPILITTLKAQIGAINTIVDNKKDITIEQVVNILTSHKASCEGLLKAVKEED